MRASAANSEAVAGHPALRAQGGRHLGAVREPGAQAGENAFEQGEIDEPLRLRKTAQAHLAGANLTLHFWDAAGLDEPAHGARNGVQEAGQKEAQIVAELEQPLGILEGTMVGKILAGDGERLAKARESGPSREVFLGECGDGFVGGLGQASA